MSEINSFVIADIWLALEYIINLEAELEEGIGKHQDNIDVLIAESFYEPLDQEVYVAETEDRDLLEDMLCDVEDAFDLLNKIAKGEYSGRS